MKFSVIIILAFVFVGCLRSKLPVSHTESETAQIEINKLLGLSDSLYNTETFNDSLFDEHLLQAFALANELDFHKVKVDIYRNVAKRYRNISEFGWALYFYQNALAIANKMEDERLKAYIKGEMAVVFRRLDDNGRALSLHFQALNWAELYNDTSLILRSYNGIGNVYLSYKNYEKAIYHFKKSLQLLKGGYQNKLSEAINTNNIGEAWLALGNTDSAAYYIKESYKTNIELGSLLGQAICENGLGDVHLKLEEYSDAIEHYNKSINLNRDIGNMIYVAWNLQDLGKTYLLLNNYTKAEQYLKEGLEISKAIGSKSNIVEIEMSLSDLYRKTGKQNLALELLNEAMLYKDTITEEVSQMNSDGRIALYKSEKQEREILILKQRDELNQLLINRHRWMLLGGALTILGGLIFSVYAIYQRRKNSRYTRKIKEQNKNIRDSIRYAQKIQSAILPELDQLRCCVDDVFVYYKPRDLVSGDFYWHTKINGLTIVATADCTGHGVPGALMSMLGVAFLNEIVIKEELIQPNVILDRLREQVILQLKQKGNFEDSKDGIDISLYVLNHDTMTLTYAGANIPIYIVRKGELIHLKGDAMPIGYHPVKNYPFTAHEFMLQKGDCIYSCTDGYHDQFGGAEGLKFMVRTLKEILKEIYLQPMNEQAKILESRLQAWQNGYEQLDDILILGIRI